mmetsp:Transcript_7963/g.21829  ORF Transcript_7963/g.21829 Transcript_7963/m.21829 type:complete len:202 (-) Transcript_7963:140-745(-)
MWHDGEGQEPCICRGRVRRRAQARFRVRDDLRDGDFAAPNVHLVLGLQLGQELRPFPAESASMGTAGARAAALEVLRALDRDGVESGGDVPGHSLAHGLLRAEEARAARACAHHHERVNKLVAMGRANKEHGRLGRYLVGVAARHVAEEEVHAEIHEVGHHDRHRDGDVDPHHVQRQRKGHRHERWCPIGLKGDREAYGHP